MDRITHEQIDRIEQITIQTHNMVLDLHKRMFPNDHEEKSEEKPKDSERTI